MPFKYRLLPLLIAALCLTGTALADTSTDQENIDQGRQEYEVRCKHCHGDNGDGKGNLNAFLKIVPADLTVLKQQTDGCVTDRVLKAVLGRHATTDGKHSMPLLATVLTPESIYLLSQYIKSIQK